jgi:hypothetical protein
MDAIARRCLDTREMRVVTAHSKESRIMIRRTLAAAAVIATLAAVAACADSTAPHGSCHITAGEWTCNTY